MNNSKILQIDYIIRIFIVIGIDTFCQKNIDINNLKAIVICDRMTIPNASQRIVLRIKGTKILDRQCFSYHFIGLA